MKYILRKKHEWNNVFVYLSGADVWEVDIKYAMELSKEKAEIYKNYINKATFYNGLNKCRIINLNNELKRRKIK